MAQIQEKNLTEKAEASLTDFLRVVGEDGGSYRTLLNEIARAVIENYNETTLYGTTQSVKGAFVASKRDIDSIKNTIVDEIYPVGSIYMSVNDTNPATLFGGEWERIQDTFLLASGTNHLSGSTGGAENVTLSVANLPAHSHTPNMSGELFVTTSDSEANNTRVTYSASGNRYVDGLTTQSHFHHRINSNSVGSGTAHNNMPPYLAVNVWKRIA